MSLRPLLLGHRGARADSSVPENTYRSFDLAFKHGCDGFEFDVRMSRDGCPVVCHDEKVGRQLVSHTSCKQMPALPRLEEVLRRYSGRGFLDMELKVSGLETKVLEILRECQPERDYVVSSFLPEVILELQARSGDVPVGIICRRPRQLMEWRTLPVDYVIVHQSLVTRRLVRLIQAAGRRLLVWTVNERSAMLRFAQWGVDGIISDKTELLADLLGRPELPD
jgi:glycerophosphoryl diester phosphodiesterase